MVPQKLVKGRFGRCVRVVKEADLNRPTLIGLNRYLLGRPAQVQILSAAKCILFDDLFFDLFTRILLQEPCI